MVSVQSVSKSTPFTRDRLSWGFCVQLNVNLWMTCVDLSSSNTSDDWFVRVKNRNFMNQILAVTEMSFFWILILVKITLWVGSVSLHPFLSNYCLWSAYLAGGTLIKSLRQNGIIDFINKPLKIRFDWLIMYDCKMIMLL